MKSMRVAMIAPPWLPIPPKGYGGIENVLLALVPELVKAGVEVELFATGDSTVKSTKTHWLYKTGQYENIHKPIYMSAPVAIAQVLAAINHIKADGGFDVIHDHNGYIGPLAYANAGGDLPPVVHTLHGPPFDRPDREELGYPDTLPMWRELGTAKDLYLVGISETLMKDAPKELKPLILPIVYNAVNVEDFPFVEDKEDYFITLARFNPEKGQAIAVRTCLELDVPLKMAGVVGDIASPKKIMLEVGNPLSVYRGVADFQYFSDEIFPHLLESKIEYVGDVSEDRKLEFISKARALLFPIQWDEPFGMAVIEAMACGTPVVAMNRGAMPEIIEHGVNGFLANNEAEFKEYVSRIDEIDPQKCRDLVARRFSGTIMAKSYIDRYNQAISMSKKK